MSTAQAQGILSQFLWWREATYGVMPTTPKAFLIPIRSETLDHSRPLVQQKNLNANRNPVKPTKGRAAGQGDVSVYLNPNAHGFLWADLLGAPNTTGASSPYTHTFTMGTAAPVGTGFEKGFTDVPAFHEFDGMRCIGLTLKVPDTGAPEATFKYAGKGEADTSPAATSVDASPDSYADVPFDCGNANFAIKEGGSTVADVTGLEFEIKVGNDPNSYTLGSGGKRGALPVGSFEVSGKLTALYHSTALYAKAKAGTETSIECTFQHGTGAGTAGNEKLTLTLAEALYETTSPKITGEGGVVVELGFQAYYENDAGAAAVKAVLLCSVPKYDGT